MTCFVNKMKSKNTTPSQQF